MKRLKIFLLFITLIAGCHPMGPSTVSRDRFDYTLAISESAKHQMLLNMVKIRYGDVPIFVDVSSVISQYQLEKELNYNFEWEYPPTLRTPSFGGSSRFSERPTVTYSPMTGEKFTTSILTPIPPTAIFFLIQSGKSVDFVFYLCVQSINGINNRNDSPMRSTPINPDFVELLSRMRRIQQSGLIGMRIQMVGTNPASVLYFKRAVTPQITEDSNWVRQKLGLDPKADEFNLIYGAVPQNDKEIAILSRSVYEILVQIAASIEVPAIDLEQTRAYKVSGAEDPLAKQMSVHIKSGKERPADAFVSILYRGKWFWIEDTDLRSKQIFSSLMTLISLMESDRGALQPVITVPTG